MGKDTADYEESEAIAIREGKKSLGTAKWLFNRRVERVKGFFVELRRNNVVHPNYYAVHCVDGVGTKLFFAPWSGNFRTASIDGGAMSANDMATIIRAYPDILNLYLACQTLVEKQKMGEIMAGFVEFAERTKIPGAPWDMNIGKLETASLDEMISLGVEGLGVDFGIAMTGFIRKEEVPNLAPKPGHHIVGVSSTGLHSNGYTGARHVIFTPEVEYRDEWKPQYKGKWHLDDRPAVLQGKTVLEVMIEPTALYLVEASLVGTTFPDRDIYGVNITGNGLHNFNRAGENVEFHINKPLPMLPVHEFLMQESGWDLETAYRKQNMGMGFAYVVPSLEIAEGIVKLINERGENRAQIVGYVKEAGKSQRVLTTYLHHPDTKEPIAFKGYSA